MKVSPVPAGQGGLSVPGTSITLNTSRPSAVPLPINSADPAVEAAREANKARSIKMRVNQTPGPREYTPAEVASGAPEGTPAPEAPAAEEAAPVVPETPVSSNNEPVTTPAEETKPLSPQQVALARQRRALQIKEREILAREKAFEEKSKPAATPPSRTFDESRLKAEPLSVLHEAGVTYEQLTEAILNGQAPDPEIYKLKQEIESLKEGFDSKLSERDAQAEAAAITEMTREAQILSRSGDDYALVRETKSVPKVMDLITRTWKASGEIIPVSEALRLVEEQLIESTLRTAQLAKVQGKLAPKPATPVAPAAGQQPAPAIRTLTNRDTSTQPLSRKDRAMQAFYGKK